MDGSLPHLLLYILGCVVLMGFFAGTEIAFTSANKLNIELRKKQGTFSGRILARFMENPAEFIGTSLIGVNILLVIFGLLLSQVTTKVLMHYGIVLPEEQYTKLIIDTVIATFIILIFAEFLPKVIFRSKADTFLTLFSVPMLIMYHMLSWLSKIFVSISEFILKYLFNVKIKENRPIFSRVDLEVFVKQSLHGHENENNDVNTELFENALYLVNVKIRKCMVPRNEVEAVDIDTAILDVRHKTEQDNCVR
jgi:putative hemolysin